MIPLTPPQSLLKVSDQMLRNESDRGFTRIYQAHNQLQNTAILGPTSGAGFKVMSGHETVTGSDTGLATGLATVAQVIASIDNGATATNFWVTARVNPVNHSLIDLFVWQPTAAGNNTPVACTTAVVVRWWVTGS